MGIIESMKDFYWDIRPKPEFGTVELRVCDMPLTVKKGVIIAAYLQALALYLLAERPVKVTHDLYHVYNFNRFQASRYGFEGNINDAETGQPVLIADDIMTTLKKIEHYANQLNNMGYISLLTNDVMNKENDTATIRKIYKQVESLPKLVQEKCQIWCS